MAQFKISLLRLSALTALVAGFGFFSGTAEAGFQWNPAPKAAAPAPAVDSTSMTPDAVPVMPAMDQGKVEADTLSAPPAPVTASIKTEETAPTMADPSAVDELPVAKTTAPVTSAAAAAAIAHDEAPTEKTSSYAQAVGFGSDIPLALGMHQIVPPEYGYVFDSSVNQGAKITWNGGKAWDQSLNDALKPLGYTAAVEGNTVHVMSASDAKPAKTTEVIAPKAALPVVTTTTSATPVATATPDSKPVREVYVRRNATGTEVDERVPGSAEKLSDQKSVTLTTADNEPKKSGFWSKVNPANWSSKDDHAADQVKFAPEQTSKVDKKVDQSGTVFAEATPTTGAADDVTSTSQNQPVMLTAPGEVSTASAVPAAPEASETATLEPKPEAQAPVLNTTDVQTWDAKKGDSLKTVLKQWSDNANVQLYWVPAQDYKLSKPVHLQGSYTDAVASALGTYGDSGPRPVGRLHPNLPTGPSVLIIEPSSSS